jgi:hypothetical protein
MANRLYDTLPKNYLKKQTEQGIDTLRIKKSVKKPTISIALNYTTNIAYYQEKSDRRSIRSAIIHLSESTSAGCDPTKLSSDEDANANFKFAYYDE